MSAGPDRLTKRRRQPEGFNRKLIVPMISGSVLNPVNSTIISVSLVPIGVAFGAPPAQTAWLVSALYLATAIGQPVVGRLVDLFGPRAIFLGATALAGAAGVLGMLAPSLPVLIIARAILGFGTCAGYPAAMSLIRSEAQRTGKDSPNAVLTALAVANQTVAVVGPTLGGLLIGLGGWRATFAINIPLSAACLIFGTLWLPRTPGQRGTISARLDFPGMGLFAAMLVSLLLFLMVPDADNWYLLLVTVAAGTALAIWELRTGEPFLDLRVLGGNLPLLATYGRAVLAYTVSYAVLYGYTQWLEQGRGLSASQAGLMQLPLFGGAIVVSLLTGRRKELRGKLVVGAISQIAACALLLSFGGTSPIWLLITVAIVFGIPQGLNSLALQNSVYRQASPERVASSGGLLRTFGYLGAIIASAANGAFFAKRADTAGMHHLAILMLAIAVLFAIVTFADRSLARLGRNASTQ